MHSGEVVGAKARIENGRGGENVVCRIIEKNGLGLGPAALGSKGDDNKRKGRTNGVSRSRRKILKDQGRPQGEEEGLNFWVT
ncbi:hypothetical protein SESBI_49858 [Sesbania bispinosa]|nr:hypothetical protein SESBI_49858 [Sesbania bispinosa]